MTERKKTAFDKWFDGDEDTEIIKGIDTENKELHDCGSEKYKTCRNCIIKNDIPYCKLTIGFCNFQPKEE